jgi:hypothetical protein
MKCFFFVPMALVTILMVYLIIMDTKWNKKCLDAGGVPVANNCVNPSAIIEVD